MARLHRDADLAVRLEATNARTMAGAWIDYDERSPAHVDLDVLRGNDAHQRVIDRLLQRVAIGDQFGGILLHMWRRLRDMLAILIAALAHDVQEQDGPLSGIVMYSPAEAIRPDMGPSGSFRFSIAMFDLVGSDVIKKHAVADVDIGQRSAPGLAAIDINHCARVSARQSPARSPQCRMLHISSAEKLCDGRLVEVRALRPDDELGMLAALKETSAQSFQRRFFVNGNATFPNGSALPSWNPICGQLYDRPRWSVRCVRSRGAETEAVL
jgi:hypothetical protein